MVNTTLRAYLDELNKLLESETIPEVIGHCRHILQHFPKNVETYRLLGRALLERDGRHEEAADVFQRVLSALPDDFVSHLGLSSVAEEQAQIPTAIWHLERAYEQDPNNMALQGELKRLYEAAGTSPQRVQLTQGALIRIYAKGHLYEQAHRELQVALAQQPNRLDLLLLQADVLWNSDHPVEAAETSLRILEKLPDSIQANRLLALLWLKSGRPSEAEPFVARLEQLDPFLAWQTVHLDGTPLPPDAFQLPRLDWDDVRAAASLATDVPDWVSAITNVFDAPESVSLSGGVTNWLEEGVPEPTAPETNPGNASPVLPDWMEEAAPAAQDDIPDWFRGAAVTDTESSAGANLPDWFDEAINTPGEAAWAENPDEQLPTGYTDILASAATPGSVPSTPPNAAIPDWLADAEPPPLPPAEPVDAMSWLMTGSLPPLEEVTPPAPKAPAEPVAPVEPAIPSEDWLSDLPPIDQTPAEPEPASAPAEMSDLDWLGVGATPMPEAPTEAVTPAEPALDWLSELPPVEPMSAEPASAPAEPVTPAEPALDWLSELPPVGPMFAELEQSSAPAEASDVDWLSNLPPVESTSAESEPVSAPAEPITPGEPALDWLNDLPPVESMSAESEPAPTSSEVSDVDWLSNLPPVEPMSAEPEPASTQAEMPDLDWLGGPATPLPEASAEPEMPIPPATPAAPGLDWLSDLRPTGNLPPEEEPASIQAEMPDLDWMGDITTPEVPEASAEPEMPILPATPAAPGLDWLSDLRPTGNLPSEAEPAPAETPGLDWLSTMGTPETPAEPTTPATSGLDWLSELHPGDQAPVQPAPAQVDNLDWLGAMADEAPSAPVQPNASSEPELLELRGSNLEPAPDEWLSSSGDVGEGTGVVTEGDPLAWLRPYSASSDETPVAEDEPTPEEPTTTDEVPSWLSAMMPSTPPGSASSAVSTDELDFGTLGPISPDEQEPLDYASTPQPIEADWLAESQEPVDEHPLELEEDWLASFEIGSQPQVEERNEAANESVETAGMPGTPSTDWLGSLNLNQPEPSEPIPQSTNWLGSLVDEPPTSQPEVSTTPEFETSAEPSTVDDWMASLSISESAPADETPSWMNEPAPETAEPEQPDWLATPEAKDHFDNLLKHATAKANEPRVHGDTGVLGSDMPDWLSAFSDDANAAQPVEGQSDLGRPEESEKTEAQGLVLDWLGDDMSLETLAASSQTELPPPEDELVDSGTVPDWLTAIVPVEKFPMDANRPESTTPPAGPTASAVQAEPVAEETYAPFPTMPPPEDAAELALPANLMNTNDSVPAGQSHFAFNRPPAWLRKKKSEPEQSSQDWLRDTGSQSDPDDLPDWLRK